MKESFFAFSLLLFAGILSAQTQQGAEQAEEEIELPDVTTVISGGALTAGKDSVPDYKRILPDQNTLGVQLPEPDCVEGKEETVSEYNAAGTGDQSVFAEGKIGGGYPFCFLGDFAVYRTTGNAPFEIKFSHENAEGFGGKTSSDGYFYRNTSIEAEKDFTSSSSKYVLSGWYENLDEGFQKKSASFTDYLWNNIGGKAEADWTLSRGFYLGTEVHTSYYNRYGTQWSTAAEPSDPWEKSAKFFTFIPEFNGGWKNDSFDISFLAKYATQLNLKDTGSLEKAEDSSSAETGQKGHFAFNFEWTDENVQMWAKAGVTFGTQTGDNSALFPFELGTSFTIPVSFSSRPLSMGIEGGLKSEWYLASYLEQNNPYSVMYCIPNEQSDWYAKVNLSMPIKNIFNLDINSVFRKTAFGNGVWAPDYTDSSAFLASGYYLISESDRTEFNTDAEFTVNFSAVKLTGGWKVFWIDVPSWEDRQSLKAAVLVEGKDAKWNAGASVIEYLGDDADKVPVLGVNASVKAASSIRLALEADDIIKLISQKTREFCHSQYKKNSGHVTALVKFQF
jgi:hypothetical protein